MRTYGGGGGWRGWGCGGDGFGSGNLVGTMGTA